MPPPPRYAVAQAARVLAAGGLVAYPTEGVWGLGCDPLDTDAVYRLLQLKRRSPTQGLILIAHALSVLEPWFESPSTKAWERITASWPGPVTWLLPACPNAPEWITGGRDTVALRVTAHPPAAALCKRYGSPIVSTSANLSGQRPARSAAEVRRRFGDGIDFVLNGKTGSLAGPTPVKDADSGGVIRP